MAKGLYINPTTFVPLSEISRNLTSEVATRQFALGGFPGFFGYLPDPDPILRKLNMDQTVYKDLRSDEQVGALMARRKNLTKSLDWRIEQGDATDKELELCERALTLLADNKNKIKDIISQSLNPIFFGYSVFEVTWAQIDGALLPVKVQEKPREWFTFDDRNNLLFRTNLDYYGIPIVGDNIDPKYAYKFILLQNDPGYDNPYGDKALSRCFWPVTFKRGGMRFFSLFVEKYGMPFIFGKLPRGAKPEDHYDLMTKLSNMVQDAVATGPDDSSIQIIEPHSASADLHEKYLQRCDNAIAKAILTNALSVERQGVGSYASTETGADTIESNLSEEDRDFPTELFNQLFKWIVDINIGSGLYPEFKPFELEDINKDKSERDKNLKEIGLKFTKKYFVNNYNLEEDDFELAPVAEPVEAPADITLPLPGAPEPAYLSKPSPLKKFWNWLTNKKIEFAEQSGGIFGDKVSGALPDKLLQFQIENTLKPVIELANKSNSRDEFIAGLYALFPDMKTDEIENLATKILFIADIEGRINV
ncbi:phage portal protein family protein [Melioribacter sp. OK-6-Me]|uniref:phage portal protein family protein n=1 Tax=unclassified Melioribacter TaxID=2627329 RepID=UPI003ED9E317